MKTKLLLIAALTVIFSSCTGSIKISADKNSACTLEYSSKMGKAIHKQISSILESQGIETSNLQLENKGIVEEIQNLDFVECDEKSMSIILSKENAQAFYSYQTDEFKNFADLLMPPVLSEDEMTKEEYINLLEMVYGKEIAKEISEAKISIQLISPIYTEKKFQMELTELLILSEPKIFKLDW